jgi:serine/threonine-protein kinase
MAGMIGTLLAGRYRLEDRIATGGMGTVWRARDELLQRSVAIKLLNEALAEDPLVAERFRREALTAASLSHPNMADVFDYVEGDGHRGIVMELVEGETLAHRIARAGPLRVAEAVTVAVGVLDVLQAAHDAGVVHRDVKPSNIIVATDGAVKVTDFGIARVAGDATLTKTGAMMGTPHYAAPEQVRGEPATAASDVYALGAVLYEALTAHRPFEGDSPVAVALARLTDDPPRPRAIRPEVPPEIDEVVTLALARDPRARFPSARAMREALERSAPDAAAALPPTESFATKDAPEQPGHADDGTRALERTAVLQPWERLEERPPRRRLPRPDRRLLLVAVVALLLVGAVALAIGFTGTRTVAVPRFTGLQVEQAQARARSLGLRVEERPRASDAPEGSVLAQSPRAGTRVERGTLVVLGVSTGTPPCCRIPDVRGLSSADAEEALRAAGLAVGTITLRLDADADEGTVLGQDPPADETLAPGSRVDLVVAVQDQGKGKGRKGRD